MRAIRTLICALALPTLGLAQTAGDPTVGTAGTTAGAAAGTATSAPTSAFPLADGDGVTFDQVIYETDDGWEPSPTGRVTVDSARVARTLGESAGFINVRTKRGWVALNIPVQNNLARNYPRAVAGLESARDMPDLPVASYFDLGSKRTRRAVYAAVLFSPEPLLLPEQFEALQAVPLTRFSLVKSHQTVNEGGIATDLAVPGPGPLPPPPANPSFAFPDHMEGFWIRMLPNPVNIEAGSNQCVPIATANALGYLNQTFGQSRGFIIGHTLNKGVVDGLQLPAELDSRMRRPVTDTCNGSGTGYCPDFPGDSSMLAGVAQYLQIWNLADQDKIHFRFQGTQGRINEDLCVDDLPIDTTEEGDEVTFDWICDRIEAGDGIVLNYHRFNELNVYSGGHSIRVHGCGMSGGRPFIRVLNDTRQDRMDDELCEERAGLESEHVWVEDLDNDGRLNYGIPGREIVFALAISMDP